MSGLVGWWMGGLVGWWMGGLAIQPELVAPPANLQDYSVKSPCDHASPKPTQDHTLMQTLTPTSRPPRGRRSPASPGTVRGHKSRRGSVGDDAHARRENVTESTGFGATRPPNPHWYLGLSSQ